MIYIKRNIIGDYVTMEQALDAKLHSDIGTTFDDYLNNMWVPLSEDQVKFKEENPSATLREVWQMELSLRTVEEAKNEMLHKIEQYDQSDNVNSFLVNNSIKAWFTPQERSNYKSSIDAAKLLGMDILSFYINDIMLNVSPINAEQMLAQIQLYADQCFIITKQHKAAVESLQTIEEIDNYDYMSNYPNRLNFDL